MYYEKVGKMYRGTRRMYVFSLLVFPTPRLRPELLGQFESIRTDRLDSAFGGIVAPRAWVVIGSQGYGLWIRSRVFEGEERERKEK